MFKVNFLSVLALVFSKKSLKKLLVYGIIVTYTRNMGINQFWQQTKTRLIH